MSYDGEYSAMEYPEGIYGRRIDPDAQSTIQGLRTQNAELQAEVRRLRVVEAAARAYGDARLTPGERSAWYALRDALGGEAT